MSLKFKFIPLTFQKDEDEIKKQIRNTIILRHLFEKSNKTVPLKALIESTQYGYNASALLSGKNKFLRISDISNGKVEWETVPFCDCDNEDTYLLYTNDLLIARTGGTTGKSFLITDPPKHSIYAGYLIRIRANKDANPLFLNLFLNSYVYWSQIVSLNEGEFRPSVNANTIKSLILPKCSLEQQLIAIKLSNNEHIDGYDSLINEINKAITNYDVCKSLSSECQRQKDLLEPLKQTILQEAIQGKLTANWRNQNPNIESATILFKRIKVEKNQLIKEKLIRKEKPLQPIARDEEPFELPAGWIWCRLGEITTYGSSKKAEPKDLNSDTWVLDLEDIEKESSRIIHEVHFSNRNSSSTKSVFKKGDVLYSKLRPYLDKVVVAHKDGVCTTEILPLEMFGNVNSHYFMYALKRKDFLQYVATKVGGMKMPRLGTEDGRNALFPLPPVEEQLIIVDKVELLMNKCQKLSQELETLEMHGKTLMKAIFNETFETKK